MKAFLAPRIRKSVLELASTKLAFDFDFLDLAEFVTVDRFLILPSTPPPSAPPAALGASCFSVYVLWVSFPVDSLVVQNIEVSGAAILLKFLMNLL